MQTEGSSRKARETTAFLWRLSVNLWVFLVIAAFFFIRILGSNLAQRILSDLKKH
jgi:hypothetical protein